MWYFRDRAKEFRFLIQDVDLSQLHHDPTYEEYFFFAVNGSHHHIRGKFVPVDRSIGVCINLHEQHRQLVVGQRTAKYSPKNLTELQSDCCHKT